MSDTASSTGAILRRRKRSRNGGLRAIVDGEYIGTRVMSRRVEIELSARRWHFAFNALPGAPEFRAHRGPRDLR